MALDIVIPVYNEGENIINLLQTLKREVATPFQCLICYDFEEDNTLSALQRAGTQGVSVRYIKNNGQGPHAAIMTGFAAATAPAVLMFPADEAYNANIIDAIYKKFTEGNDVVVASRFAHGGSLKGGPPLKSALVRIASFLLHTVVGLPATDATYGLRLFSKKILDTVVIESTAGFTYAIELLVKCHRLRWGIGEVPARWHVREKGVSRFRLRQWLPHYTKWFLYALATRFLTKTPMTVKLKNTLPMHAESYIVTHCQICDNTELERILFLGYLPPVNNFHPLSARPTQEQHYPAEILFCTRCHLVQSGFVVDPKIIFPPSYPYTSGTTKLLRDNFAELYQEVTTLFTLQADDLVVDIGSNDGTLLSNFKGKHRVLGVTPEDIGKLAIAQGIPTILDYFTKDVARAIKQEYGNAKIITAANVFAHIDKVNDVVEAIKSMLSDDGLFIIETHYLMPIITMNQFDTIYHEHLRHYSLHSLQYLLEQHGFEVIHVKHIPSHAGSMRVYAARKSTYAVKETVAPFLAAEKDTVLKKEQLFDFKKRSLLAKLELMSLLHHIKREGGRIYGIGAPSRGTTLIHYTGIDENILECVLEIKGSHKLNAYVPGTLIPVLEETKLYDKQPEYALLLSWQIADELIPKLKAKGFKGKFIVPLPHPRVV